jgi:hypothetical protein
MTSWKINMRKFRVLIVALSMAFFSAVLISPTLLDRASIRDSEVDAGEDEFTSSSSPGEEALEGSGRRRLLGGSKWKKRKACPPGLKICLEEEKALAAEKAAKKAMREEEEAKQAEELEEASAKVRCC